MVWTRSHHCHFWLIALALLWPVVASLPAAADTNDRFAGHGDVLCVMPWHPDWVIQIIFLSKIAVRNATLMTLDGRRPGQLVSKLAAADIKFSAIYSSYWCRCLETAQLLGLGAVTPFDGLNSFFRTMHRATPRWQNCARNLIACHHQHLPA